MSDERILMQMLETSGALRRGHFLLSSGLHSEAYVQCALLLEEPVRARQVGHDLAELLRQFHPDSVLSPPWAASSSATRWRRRWACPSASASARERRWGCGGASTSARVSAW